MSKSISIEFEGTTYTLCYTKRSVQNMERAGFVADDLDRKPMTMIPMLVRGAFQAKHPLVNDKTRDRVYEAISDKAAFIEALGELYNIPMLEMIAEPEGEEKNVATWSKNWKDS